MPSCRRTRSLPTRPAASRSPRVSIRVRSSSIGELTPLDVAIPEFAPPAPPVAPVPEPEPAPAQGGGPEAKNATSKPAARTTKSRMFRAGGPYRTRTDTWFPTRDVKADSGAREDTPQPDSSGFANTRSDTKAPIGKFSEPESDRNLPAGAAQSSVDSVEAALAEAVSLAARAGQWGTVEILSRELAARRLAASSPEIPTLEVERARREREK